MKMDFLDGYYANFSPARSDEFSDLFVMEDFKVETEQAFNPDEFLNMDEFVENIKKEPDISKDQYSPQQLTPPISPQPVNSIQVRIIPISTLQYQPQPAPHLKRMKPIVPKPSSSSDSDSNPSKISKMTPGKSNSPLDKALIKQQRLIRNREAANQSRKKQKDYVVSLEATNAKLTRENSDLKAENSLLRERLTNYSLLTCRCASTISNKLPSKNTAMLMAVLLVFIFNVVPFSSFLISAKKSLVMAPPQFNSRHLLVSQNLSEIVDNLEDKPVYFNQTDHIRKLNIENIRRWIPEPDILNASIDLKNFDFNPDPLQEKLAKMYEKSREQSKTKKRPQKKKKIPTEPLQLYNKNHNVIKLFEFFDEIDRKDDVFYVFSFKADHLLLPAIDNYNFSQIKMNLIMPKNNDSLSSDKITMFQIETIILNTSFIQIAEKSIPENFLKPNMNATTCNETSDGLNPLDKLNTSFNDTTSPENTFQSLDKAEKFSSYFRRLNLLKDAKK